MAAALASTEVTVADSDGALDPARARRPAVDAGRRALAARRRGDAHSGGEAQGRSPAGRPAGGRAGCARRRDRRRRERRRRGHAVNAPGAPGTEAAHVKMAFFSAEVALNVQLHAFATGVIGDIAEEDPDDGVHVVPGAIRRALAELRLLHGVPFTYLVPDATLLPPESIRFFYLDRNWTDALVDGVLSIGTFTTAERLQLEALRQVIRDEVDEAERVLRRPRRRGATRRTRRPDQRLPAALEAGVGLARAARARLPGRPGPGRRDHPGVRPRPAEGAAHGAAGPGRAARAVRRRARGGPHRGAAPGHPVRRAAAAGPAAVALPHAAAARRAHRRRPPRRDARRRCRSGATAPG